MIIYYFFDSSNKTSLRTTTFLRSILHQAINLDSLLPSLQRRLESIFVDQIDQSEPDTDELIELFVQFYKMSKNGFLLIDGLDEADKSDQKNIKFFFKQIQKVDSARILVISHPDIDMSKVFARCHVLQIQPEDLKGDIELFIQGQIDEHAQEGLSVCPPSLLDKLKHALLSGADEMYTPPVLI